MTSPNIRWFEKQATNISLLDSKQNDILPTVAAYMLSSVYVSLSSTSSLTSPSSVTTTIASIAVQQHSVIDTLHTSNTNYTPTYSTQTAILCNKTETDIWKPHVIQRVTTIVIAMVMALIGNTAIILMLTCTRYRKRHSRVNIFIVHLAIGDLTVCFCTMTTEIIFVAFGEWVLGPVLCKLIPYLQMLTLSCTIFILTTMSFDRYLAICKPLKYRATTARAKKFIAASWALAFILCVPQLFIFVQTEDPKGCRIKYYCKSKGYTAEWQRKVYITFLTLYVLILPVILISFFYTSIVMVVSKASKVVQNNAIGADLSLRRPSTFSGNSTFPRAKVKTLKMTFAIIASFVICWTPYLVTTSIRIYSDYKIVIPDSVMALVETITFVQSVLNPILYGAFNVKMKQGIRELVCGGRRYDARRSPSYNNNRSPGLVMSLTGGAAVRYRTKPIYEMNIRGANKHQQLLQDPMQGNHVSFSSSGNSQERSLRNSSVVLTEENKNGVRLRVRFPSREPYKQHASTESLDYPNTKADYQSACNYLTLPKSHCSQTKLYRPHSHQHLLYSPLKS